MTSRSCDSAQYYLVAVEGALSTLEPGDLVSRPDLGLTLNRVAERTAQLIGAAGPAPHRDEEELMPWAFGVGLLPPSSPQNKLIEEQ